MEKYLPKQSKGFSLVELLIVIVIVGFTIIVIATLPSSLKLIGGSQDESLAKEIVAKRVEDVRSMSYSALTDGTSSFSDTKLLDLPQGAGETIIAPCPSSTCTNNEAVKQVTVNVTWTDRNGQQKKVSVDTFISDGGLQ